MRVQSWAVGVPTVTSLSMTAGDISGHLLADWIPSFPLALSSSFVGWPSFLIDTVNVQAQQFLTLAAVTRTSERQWKGVLSWMLGVAGARHALAADGYRWIAPLSAFYLNNVQQVAVQANAPFPLSSITVESDPNSTSRLRPDYLATRPVTTGQAGAYEWALVEAKGSASSLANKSAAPQAWRDQVRNAVVKVNGGVVSIPRHLVICTRVNPNAARPATRRLQLRSWNKTYPEAAPLSAAGTVDVAAAYLFGLFKGLHLPEYAAAISASVEVRTRARLQQTTGQESDNTKRTANAAEERLKRRTKIAPPDTEQSDDTWVALTTPESEIDIGLAAPLLALARELSQAQTDDEAAAVLQNADTSLDLWEASRRSAKIAAHLAVLNTGITVRVGS